MKALKIHATTEEIENVDALCQEIFLKFDGYPISIVRAAIRSVLCYLLIDQIIDAEPNDSQMSEFLDVLFSSMREDILKCSKGMKDDKSKIH